MPESLRIDVVHTIEQQFRLSSQEQQRAEGEQLAMKELFFASYHAADVEVLQC